MSAELMVGELMIDEARRAGEAYLAQFDFDLKAACEDLQRRTEEARRAGREVVSHPPRRINLQPGPTKKVG